MAISPKITVNLSMESIENLKKYANGGIVYPVSPAVPQPYKPYQPYPNGGYTFQSVPTVVRTVEYTKDGRTLKADVLSDGTVHVDPEVFDMMMKEIGFE